MDWSIVGWVCGGLVVLFGVGGPLLKWWEVRRRRRVIAEGDQTTGWLVQANDKLFEEGQLDLPAFVLISPDKATAEDAEFMGEVLAWVGSLKDTEPDDPDEAEVAAFVTDEMYQEGKRLRIAPGLVNGREVYIAHIYIYRGDLPWRKLTEPTVACAVNWDDPKSMICSRPAPPKKRKRRAND